MFRKNFLIAAIIAVSPVAFASHASPPISFSIGNVNHGTSVNFGLNKVPLTSGEFYSITCDIKNPNYSNQYPIVMSLYAYSNTSGTNISSPTITLNGKPLNAEQAALTQPDNFYAAWPVNGDGILNFVNYDNSDDATVTNCVATPVVQSTAK